LDIIDAIITIVIVVIVAAGLAISMNWILNILSDGEENTKTQTTKNKGIKFENDSGVNEYVGVGFNKSAFFFNSLWLIKHKHFGKGVLMLIFQIFSIYILETNYNDTLSLFYIIIHLPIQFYLGFNGNKMREERLKWYGFKKVEKEQLNKNKKEE